MSTDAENVGLSRVAVLVKDVPAGPELPPLQDDFTLAREQSDSTMSGVDIFAVAAARRMSSEVVAITMGPAQAAGALREALAAGADRAIHLNDDRLKDATAGVTARVLAQVVSRLDVEVVVLGRESSDGRMGVLGGMIAELLGWSLISAADEIRTNGVSIFARVKEHNFVTHLETKLPAVLTVAEYGSQLLPIDSGTLERTFLTPIERWNLEMLPSLDASRTTHQVQTVKKVSIPRKTIVVEGHHEAVQTLLGEIETIRNKKA